MRYILPILLCALVITVAIIVVTPRNDVERTLSAASALGSLPVLAEAPDELVLEPSLVMTAERGQRNRIGVAYVSNERHYITLMTFGAVPHGEWDATLELTCTGPGDRQPLWIWVRVVTTGWGPSTTHDGLTEVGDWLAAWSDGVDRLVVTGPGVYRVKLPNVTDYWHDVADYGLALVAARPYSSAGRTYRFDVHRVRLHLTRRG